MGYERELCRNENWIVEGIEFSSPLTGYFEYYFLLHFRAYLCHMHGYP